jgi:hypothetical protein
MHSSNRFDVLKSLRWALISRLLRAENAIINHNAIDLTPTVKIRAFELLHKLESQLFSYKILRDERKMR